MFDDCKSLKTLNLSPNFKMKSNTDFNKIFYGCDSLNKQNIIKLINK